MEFYHFAWVLAGITGMAAGGLAGNGWALVTGERPNLRMLSEYSAATPLRLLALLAYAPLATVEAGLSHIKHNPVFAMIMLAAGLFWSFMQGVFILTAFFGYT